MSSKISCIKPMGFRQGSLALAGMLAVALAAQAQTTAVSVLDDFEAGSNQNKFLGYSYFYNDATDGGTSVVNSSAPGSKASELLVDPVKSFDAGYGGSTKSLKMDFTYGANKPKSCGGTCAYGQMVGFGTQFVPGTDVATGTGKTLDLTGATAITFYAKANAAMKMRVEITTTNVTDFGYYVTTVPLTTDWARQTVSLSTGLGGVAQPSWAVAVPLDLTLVQKLQFSISADDNAGLTAGTVWLDSIAVQGYTWVPPTACTAACVVTTPAAGALLSNLEADSTVTPKRAANQNAAGGFWFVYNDVGARTVATQKDYSEIFAGVDLTNITPTVPVFKLSPGKGVNASNAAYIGFTLGPTYTDKGSVVQPFVGLGTKTSDALGTSAMDASGSTGIEFDYKTDSNSTFQYLRLEAYSNQTNLGTNTGVVHNVLLPATGGAWKTVNVPWTKFSLPNWVDVPDPTVPLKISGITKFQWAIQDAPGTTGGLAIDNVIIVGATSIKTPIRFMNSQAENGMRFSQDAGRLDVSFNLLAGVSKASVSLVDLKGAVVASQTVSGKGLQLTSLDTRSLRSGVYSLQVRQGDVVRGARVSLLK